MTKTPKTEELQKKIDELTGNWKRALADYQNLERRASEEKGNLAKLAAKEIVIKLLPVLDSLGDAANHLKDDGLNLCVRKFEEVLKGEGLERIETDGKEFDPRIMECVEAKEGDEDNKIKETVLAGYNLNGVLIRPAKVKVVKKKLNQEEEEKAKTA